MPIIPYATAPIPLINTLKHDITSITTISQLLLDIQQQLTEESDRLLAVSRTEDGIGRLISVNSAITILKISSVIQNSLLKYKE